MSQREAVLSAIAPGHLVYVYMPGHYEGVYHFAGATCFGLLLLGSDALAEVAWFDIRPPF